MNPERWQRVNELFAAVVDRTSSERERILLTACADDRELRDEVVALVAAHEQAAGFIEQPAFRVGGEVDASSPTADTSAAFAPGFRLGPYEIRGLLGAGGMGEVYRARDPRLDRDVAIKTLPRDSAGDLQRQRRFEQEARAVGALQHPNILAIFDVGAQSGVPYVVTELLEGETLRRRLLTGTPSLAEALEHARQIAAGLAAAHQKGIVHRDLKPANVFVTQEGVVKILDFGLAKRQPMGDDTADASLTQPGLAVGTAGYMSPEQVRGGKVERSSDIFSFGCVLYELLSGARAFSGDSAVETMSAVLQREPPPLVVAGRPAPARIEALVRRCLAKDPARRVVDGAELVRAIDEVLRRAPGDETPTAAQPAPATNRRQAVAVLPFRDLARDPRNAHLGLGLADATITELARHRTLVVRPTSAILRYQDAPPEPLAAARELGVDGIVDASFQRQGNALRLSVQLLSGGDGQPLWATKLDASLEDLFRMQDEVSRNLARALELELGLAEKMRDKRPRETRVPVGEAYEHYLKGRTFLFRESLEHCLTAIDCFDRACAVDPDFALGWAGLADACSRIAFTFLPEGEWYNKARAACERALALDPDLPEARYVRGGRLRWSPREGFDHEGALRDLVPALVDRPGLEEAHVRLGVILHHVGLIDEVERSLDQALLISPGHALAHQHRGLCHYSRGRYAESLAIYETASREMPEPWLFYRVALCQIQLGLLGNAMASVDRMLRQTPNEVLAHPILGLLAALRGDATEARRQVRLTVEKRRDFGHFHHAQYDLACIDAQLGDRAAAVGWLRQAAANGFPCLVDFAGDPLLRSLRGDQDYQTLLAELAVGRDRYAALYAELRRERA